MKKIILGLAVLFVLAVTVSCKKKKEGNEGGCGEQAIKATTNPAVNTVDPPAPGTDFPLVVNIEPLPATGATVIVSAKTENNGSVYFTETREKALSSNLFTITQTPPGVSCMVTVTVTSATCNTNTWSGSYRYTAK
ncbi:hypothetical protein A4H97_01720 [Niastella yeongjuensis]|uniref:Uncharacterized protein n=1 Tax=Niastella yeongjuensis TaxID=354355 RepID=A0A1V9EWT3_9BACT|nr:hypothetical protein [Niastella yeongjuensis]OQP50583.1 hypothetical protein A4H97_01720 [Niastella yeongjuensis]SEN27593.1 hypothetical protein SAMN05660816_00601 [Niastella yeongjuensis]